MIIEVRDNRELVAKYLTIISSLTGWSRKETEVAIAIVQLYTKLQQKRADIIQELVDNGESTDEVPTTMEMFKDKSTLKGLSMYLNLPFSSFRNYISKLKASGFFIAGDINPIYLGISDEVEIKIKVSDEQEGSRRGI